MSFLKHRNGRLEIFFELYAKKFGLSNSDYTLFRGVAVLMDKYESLCSTILNKAYHVCLKPVEQGDTKRLALGMGQHVRDKESNDDYQGDSLMVLADNNAPIVIAD